MASVTELTNFAQTMSIPYYVGAEFAAEHGGRLPTSIAELEAWGNSTGRHNPDGSWVSKTAGSAPPSTPQPPGTPPTPGGDLISQLTNWVKANPSPAAIIGFIVWKKM